MDYEQKYKESLERAKEQLDGAKVFDYDNEQIAHDIRTTVYRIFPELKESEDEKIRKWLIGTIKQVPDDSIEWETISKSDILAWLEKQGQTFTKKDVDDAYLKGVCDTKQELKKQGEQKSKKVSLWKHWKDGIAGNGEGKPIYLVKVDNTYRLTSCLGFECDYIELSELDSLMFDKQGEQKHKFNIGDIISNGQVVYRVDDITKNCIGRDCYFLVHVESEKNGLRYLLSFTDSEGKHSNFGEITLLCEQVDKSFEKQGEQKTIDKVEPKFHEWEWLCENEPNNYARFIQILETVNVQGKERYRISRDIHNNEDVVEFDFVEKYYHKFDIKDAKDGDVLVHNSFMFDDFIFIYNSTSILQVYCYYSKERNRFIIEDRGHHYPWNMQEVTPATKEQREQLEKAMADAGYTFDFEKKELKKIEQTPTWSEEDEFMRRHLMLILMQLGFCGVKYSTAPKYLFDREIEWLCNLHPQPKEEWSKKDEAIKLAWLKSLIPQNTWKPSEEQIEILNMVLTNESMDDNIARILRELREQLKKLKGE